MEQVYSYNPEPTRGLFSRDYSRLSQVPIGLPKKELKGLVVQDYLQAGCPSCHPTQPTVLKALKETK